MKNYLLVLPLAIGCGTTNSSNLLTKGISASITASTDGTGTTKVSASLFNGVPSQLIFVDLEGTDTLTATHGSSNQPMQKEQLGNIIVYSTTFATGNAGDSFTIDLMRTVDAGAPSSTTTLPAAFTLGTVATQASRAQAMTVTWSPTATGDQMSWKVTGTCINDANGSTVDNGTMTIAANTLIPQQGAATSCTATLTIQRSQPGTLDPHYGMGGSIDGEQSRTATFTTAP
jgi:hypothetical protein